MPFLMPPRILKWDLQSHNQRYQTNKKILVTSGCSFTNCNNLSLASNWPGYVRDRCGFEYCVDLSYPGVGNEYIANSVLNYVDALSIEQRKEIILIVMWSGLDRLETLTKDLSKTAPSIDGIEYRRANHGNNISNELSAAEVWRSWKNIVFLDSYLCMQNIQYAFTSYVNLLDPPFFPKRDLTPHFFGNLSKDKLQTLKSMPWLHNHQDCLFEYCFKNDHLSSDLFHPNYQGGYNWTDYVLLPGMLVKEFIQKL
jgi:hypothetical protein